MNDPIRPSRHLNERAGVLGLSVFDCAGLAYLLVALSRLLEGNGSSWIAFVVTGVVGLGLVGVGGGGGWWGLGLVGRLRLIHDPRHW